MTRVWYMGCQVSKGVSNQLDFCPKIIYSKKIIVFCQVPRCQKNPKCYLQSQFIFLNDPQFLIVLSQITIMLIFGQKSSQFCVPPFETRQPILPYLISTYFNVFNAISSLSFSLYLLSLIRHKKYLAQNSICCFRINWLRPYVGLVKQ